MGEIEQGQKFYERTDSHRAVTEELDHGQMFLPPLFSHWK